MKRASHGCSCWDPIKLQANTILDTVGEYEVYAKNLAIAISIEANELLENFLWFNNPSANAVAEDDELMEEVKDELADVVIYSMAMANQLNIDLLATVEQKIEENEERFDE